MYFEDKEQGWNDILVSSFSVLRPSPCFPIYLWFCTLYSQLAASPILPLAGLIWTTGRASLFLWTDTRQISLYSSGSQMLKVRATLIVMICRDWAVNPFCVTAQKYIGSACNSLHPTLLEHGESEWCRLDTPVCMPWGLKVMDSKAKEMWWRCRQPQKVEWLHEARLLHPSLSFLKSSEHAAVEHKNFDRALFICDVSSLISHVDRWTKLRLSFWLWHADTCQVWMWSSHPKSQFFNIWSEFVSLFFDSTVFI